MKKLRIGMAAIVSLAVMGGCANMTTQQKNTAVGAAVGGVAGSVLTDHGTLGTLGGAAIGGYIGNQVKH